MVQESYSIKKTSKSKKGSQRVKNREGSQRDSSVDARGKQELDIPSQVRSALVLITGQKAEERLFRVSRPGLNIREGRLASLRVTLRRKSIYFFLDRLISDILPNLKGEAYESFEGFQKKNKAARSISTSSWLDDGSNQRQIEGAF